MKSFLALLAWTSTAQFADAAVKTASLSRDQAKWVIIGAVLLALLCCVCYLYRRLFPEAEEFTFTSLALNEPRYSKLNAFEVAMKARLDSDKKKEVIAPRKVVPDSFLSQSVATENRKLEKSPMIPKAHSAEVKSTLDKQDLWREWDKYPDKPIHVDDLAKRRPKAGIANSSSNRSMGLTSQSSPEKLNRAAARDSRNKENSSVDRVHSNNKSSGSVGIGIGVGDNKQDEKEAEEDKEEEDEDGAEAPQEAAGSSIGKPLAATRPSQTVIPAAKASSASHQLGDVRFPPRNVALPPGPAPKTLLAVKMAADGKTLQGNEEYKIDIQVPNRLPAASSTASRPSTSDGGNGRSVGRSREGSVINGGEEDDRSESSFPKETTAKILADKKSKASSASAAGVEKAPGQRLLSLDSEGPKPFEKLAMASTVPVPSLVARTEDKTPSVVSQPVKNPLAMTRPPRPGVLSRPNSAVRPPVTAPPDSDHLPRPLVNAAAEVKPAQPPAPRGQLPRPIVVSRPPGPPPSMDTAPPPSMQFSRPPPGGVRPPPPRAPVMPAANQLPVSSVRQAGTGRIPPPSEPPPSADSQAASQPSIAAATPIAPAALSSLSLSAQGPSPTLPARPRPPPPRFGPPPR